MPDPHGFCRNNLNIHADRENMPYRHDEPVGVRDGAVKAALSKTGSHSIGAKRLDA